MNMRIKEQRRIAFCDLDGTVLDAQERIKYEIFRYIESLAEEKYVVTGRSKISLLSIRDYVRLQEIFDSPMICYNGNALWKPEEGSFEIIHGIENAKGATERLMKHKIEFTVDADGAAYAATASSALKYALYNQIPRKLVRIGLEGIRSESQALLFHIYCGVENLSFIQEMFGEHEIHYEFWPAYLMIYPAGTDKVNGIQYLLKKRREPAVKIITIGNGDNDVEMTRFADWGIAVPESTDRLKKEADFILEFSS